MFWQIIATLIISILMGMGVGGGGLLVIFLTLCLNYGQILAQGTNLALFILSAIASLFVHFKKRKIRFLQVLTLILCGSLGSFIFSGLANSVSPSIPKKVLGALLVTSGMYTIFNIIKRKNTK